MLAQTASAAESGRYAIHQSVAVQVKNPNPLASSRWTTVRTEGWGFADVRVGEGALSYTETTCDIATSKVFGTTTEYSPAFIESLGTRERTAIRDGSEWRVGPFTQTIGADDGALPTEGADAVDTDGDGFPGVTVSVKQAVMGEGDVYVAQRTTNTIRLAESDVGWTGTIDSQVEEVVLDATTWWLKADRSSRPHPDPGESTVRLVPVDADADCDAILRDRQVLFGAVP